MKRYLFGFVLLIVIFGIFPESIHAASTYYVATTGSDTNPGTLSQPWKTIRKAVNTLKSGDTALVQAGTYNEETDITSSGITLQAQGKVIAQAFRVEGNSDTIKGFTVADLNSDWGIMTNGNNNLIEGNEIYHTRQDGVWFFGSNNTFRGNYIHDILDPSYSNTTHVDCFQTWGSFSDANWTTANILIEKNICINNRTDDPHNQIIMLENQSATAVKDIMIRNNIFVIYDPIYCALNFDRVDGQVEASNISVLNNTVVNIGRTPLREFTGICFGGITNPTAINNLVINFGNTSFWPNHPYGTTYITVSNSTNLNIHNNAVYNTDGIPPAETPYPGDIWMQDPKVVNLTGLDFHLQPTSPLIDKGTDLSGQVIDDYDGNPRPQGSGYDIGAYEFVTGATSVPSPTSAPTATPTVLPTATPIYATLTQDVNISATSTTGAPTTAAFNTNSTNELLIAMVSSDIADNLTSTTVSGAGLTWTRVLRNLSGGYGLTEVWTAYAPSQLTGTAVSFAYVGTPSYNNTLLHVISFTGASPILGASLTPTPGSGTTSASNTITTTVNNSWIWAVGEEWDHNLSHTAGTNQTITSSWADSDDDSFQWTQKLNSVTPSSGTTVTVSNTAPTGSTNVWNWTIFEVKPAILTPSPTSTPFYWPGDINHDGIVNIQDYTLLSNAFGTNNSAADINADGIVNVQDYILLSNNFGKTGI